MAWFFKKNKQENLTTTDDKVHNFLTRSFNHVKSDIQNVVEWLRYFNQKHEQHDHDFLEMKQRIQQIEHHLSYIPYIHTQLQHLQNQPDKHQILLQKVRNLHDKVSMINHDHGPILRRLEEIETSLLNTRSPSQPIAQPIIHKLDNMASRLEILENQPVSQFKKTVKEKIFSNITRNSKEYVKKLILSLITKYQSISATQLRQIVVDEQGLCSKSTFYRILKEAEEQDFIGVITHGKEKKYMAKELSNV